MNNIASPAPRALRDPSRASRQGITADPIIRACFAEFVARANAGKIKSADEVAASLWPGDPVSRAVVRAAQAPGSAGDHGALIGASVGQFLSSLPQSAGAGILARCLDVQLAQGGSVLVPYDAATEIVPPWVGEAEPIPVNSGVTAAITIGPACKLGVVLTVTRSLFRQPGAEALFQLMLQRRAAAAFDAAVFATTAADTDRVAGLLHSVTPIDAGTVGDLGGALETLAGALAESGGSGQIIIATDPKTAATVQLRHPQLAWPVLASRYIPAGRIVAIDPTGLVFGTGGELDISTTIAAILHMSDDPAEIVSDAAAAADPVREIFQTDGVALRLLVDLAFSARPGAVQYMDGGQW